MKPPLSRYLVVHRLKLQLPRTQLPLPHISVCNQSIEPRQLAGRDLDTSYIAVCVHVCMCVCLCVHATWKCYMIFRISNLNERSSILQLPQSECERILSGGRDLWQCLFYLNNHCSGKKFQSGIKFQRKPSLKNTYLL